jgi:hypothetical protein
MMIAGAPVRNMRSERTNESNGPAAARGAHRMKEQENLWKAAAQAAVIGLAGAAAMFAAEMLLFPGVVRVNGVSASFAEPLISVDMRVPAH